MEIKDWLPTLITTGALGVVWFFMRRMVADLQAEIKEMKKEINNIKDTYIDQEKHALICGKSALEIERLFTKCLNQTKDAIFTKLRDFEKKLPA